ncbi:MAG: hypothetical protein V1720_02395 [bacterium]
MLIIVFTFLGCFAGLYNFIKIALNFNKKRSEKSNNSDS